MTNRQFASTRRRFVASTAGATALLALGGSGRAFAQEASPVVPAASPGATPAAVEPPDMTGASYAFQVGDFSCLNVSDGANAGPGLMPLLFGQVPDQKTRDVLSAAAISPGQLVSQNTLPVIDTGDDLVLIDTGSGAQAGPTVGLLLDNLRREGIQPEDITVVAFTHGHADHVGGNVSASGNPLFSNARYIMVRAEWEFWTDETRVNDTYPAGDFRDAQLASVQRNLVGIQDAFELVPYDTEIAPGIRTVPAEGHTPGHTAYSVQSGGDQFWVLGDVALAPVDLAYPELAGIADANPEQMAQTRRQLFAQLAESGSLTTFKHFAPFPSLGHIAASGDVWEWQPVEAQSEDDSE